MDGIEMIESKLTKTFNETQCNLLKWIMIQRCYSLNFDDLAKKFEKSLEPDLVEKHHITFQN